MKMGEVLISCLIKSVSADRSQKKVTKCVNGEQGKNMWRQQQHADCSLFKISSLKSVTFISYCHR